VFRHTKLSFCLVSSVRLLCYRMSPGRYYGTGVKFRYHSNICAVHCRKLKRYELAAVGREWHEAMKTYGRVEVKPHTFLIKT
jgi:hypothetical protein